MKITWSTVLALLLAATPGQGQEKAEGPKPSPRLTPLKVQVVFQRYQGDKKVASLPYVLYCNAGETKGARVRVGVDVPIATRVDNAPQVVYKSVGMAVDCEASEVEPGLFKLELSTDQSSIYSLDKPGAASDTTTALLPSLHSFRASFTPILRDGQGAQYAMATDPLSGEQLKIDVALSIAK